MAAAVAPEADLTLRRGDDIAACLLAPRAHEPAACGMRRIAIRKLEVLLGHGEHLAVADGAQVHDIHRFGVTFARAPIDPLPHANNPVPGGTDHVARNPTEYGLRVALIPSLHLRRHTGKPQIRGDRLHIEAAIREVEDFVVAQRQA